MLLAAALLAGCTAGGDGETPSPTRSAPTDASTSSAAPSASPSPSATGAPQGGAPGAAEPEGVLPTAEPVALSETADFGTGVTSELAGVEAIRAEPQGPGEIAGPALAFDISLTNTSAAAVDLGAVTVNLTDDAGVPGLPMTGPPATPFSGSLAPGASVTGTYVFAVDEGSRSVVALEVSYSTQAPVVVFRGDPADV